MSGQAKEQSEKEKEIIAISTKPEILELPSLINANEWFVYGTGEGIYSRNQRNKWSQLLLPFTGNGNDINANSPTPTTAVVSLTHRTSKSLNGRFYFFVSKKVRTQPTNKQTNKRMHERIKHKYQKLTNANSQILNQFKKKTNEKYGVGSGGNNNVKIKASTFGFQFTCFANANNELILFYQAKNRHYNGPLMHAEGISNNLTVEDLAITGTLHSLPNINVNNKRSSSRQKTSFVKRLSWLSNSLQGHFCFFFLWDTLTWQASHI